MKDPLSITHPQVAAQWHPAKNGDLTPDQVTAGVGKKVWWKCPNGLDHEWQSTVNNRTKPNYEQGCPCCSGRKVSITNSLATQFPELVEEWHPRKNGNLTPAQVVAGSGINVWWKCPNGSDHEWQARVGQRTNRHFKSGCPFCRGLQVSITNSLSTLFPEIAKQWHPIKNGQITPEQVVAGSNKQYWWKCPNGSDHEWRVKVNSRTSFQTGCPFCVGKQVSVTNSLATRFPEIAKQWHPTKNGSLTPERIVSGCNTKYWWKCANGLDHEWFTSANKRVSAGHNCPFCGNQKVSVTNSLATCFPDIAKQWHPTKNGNLNPDQVIAGSEKKVWWRCEIDPSHSWEAVVYNRTKLGFGCPTCNRRWTVQAIRGFVSSLINHLETFTSAELYLLLQQSGLLLSKGNGKGFVKALATGRFPAEEIKKFVNGEPSTVDKFLQDKQLTLEALETSSNDNIPAGDVTSQDKLDDQIDETVEPSEEDDLDLPVVQTREVLASLDHSFVSSADEEAVEFLRVCYR